VELRFAAPGERRQLPPDLSASGVQTWRTPSGEVIAHGYRQGSTCWMQWPALAAYRFAKGDPFVTAFVDPGAARDVVTDVYHRAVLPIALQALGREALHASGVLMASGVVAFAARSHTGKSTFAYALSRRGFPQWADDGLVMDVEQRRVTTVPLPFEVRLRAGSSALFGFDDPVFRQFTPEVAVARAGVPAAPLAAICLLDRVSSRSAASPHVFVSRMSASDAFSAVLIHAHEFDPLDSERRRRMLEAYLDVVDRVPVYRVQFATGRQHLDGVLDGVIGALAMKTPSDAELLVA
jgi:hypothetical protein